ncbi:MAG TPA: PHP domain-containing protein [Anaerolineae bacterium]|nr:PHP domain-containing protein [Anaerolineae bacterium]
MRVDLHIHTTASDGCWSPERVVAEARSRDIGLFAVADHDTIRHVAAAKELARAAGVAFLKGVEVSARVDGYLFHILAYGIDTGNNDLVEVLEYNTTIWEQDNDAVIHGLIAAGLPFTWIDYEAYEHDRTLGGWKPLRFLVARGLCAGINDYFAKLVRGLSLPPTRFAHPADAIAAINQAEGVAVLAHPGGSLRNSRDPASILRALMDMGLGGIECYSTYHDEETTGYFLEWCRSHALLITGGSDSHGGFVGREMGVPIVDISDLELGELLAQIAW